MNAKCYKCGGSLKQTTEGCNRLGYTCTILCQGCGTKWHGGNEFFRDYAAHEAEKKFISARAVYELAQKCGIS